MYVYRGSGSGSGSGSCPISISFARQGFQTYKLGIFHVDVHLTKMQFSPPLTACMQIAAAAAAAVAALLLFLCLSARPSVRPSVYLLVQLTGGQISQQYSPSACMIFNLELHPMIKLCKYVEITQFNIKSANQSVVLELEILQIITFGSLSISLRCVQAERR